jgi:opacity protein-like surface antigen
MKRLLVGVAVPFIATAGQAVAEGLPPMGDIKPPAVVAGPTWSGLYVGAGIGAGVLSNDFSGEEQKKRKDCEKSHHNGVGHNVGYHNGADYGGVHYSGGHYHNGAHHNGSDYDGDRYNGDHHSGTGHNGNYPNGAGYNGAHHSGAGHNGDHHSGAGFSGVHNGGADYTGDHHTGVGYNVALYNGGPRDYDNAGHHNEGHHGPAYECKLEYSTESFGGNDTGDIGVFGTVTVGYDRVLHRGWVGGVFADYDFGSNISAGVAAPLQGGSLDHNSSWAVGARLGYLVAPSVLLYGAAGYTQGDFELSGLASRTFGGYFVGAGIETLLHRSWSLRLEYRFSQFAGETVAADANTSVDLEPSIHSARLVLTYKLGRPD